MASRAIDRVFEAAWTRSQLAQRYLALTPEAVQQIHELLSHMLYPNGRLRPASERLSRNQLGQAGLWSMSISGDLPILCVLVSDERALTLVREVLVAHTYWRMQGFQADLVILNQEGPAYDRPLRTRILDAARAHSAHTGLDTPGGVFLKDWHTISEVQRDLLLAASRVVLHGARGRLGRQLSLAAEPVNPMRSVVSRPAADPKYDLINLPFLELDYFNGLGGFHKTDNEYCIYVAGKKTCPRPWVNVIAGPEFGTIVSDSGLGNTWSGNSQLNRLTPWRNDPVSDTPSEIIYVRDEETGHFWSPTPLPAGTSDAYRARHGFGYSVFEHNHYGIEQELSVFVPNEHLRFDPVKICVLKLVNRSGQPRSLAVVFFADWVMGAHREEAQLHVRTSFAPENGSLLAHNVWSADYATRPSFAFMAPRAESYSGDRARFIGRNGRYSSPQALTHQTLDRRVGAGLDPCAALQTSLTLQPGEARTVHVMFGQAATRAQADEIIARYATADRVDAALMATKKGWSSALFKLKVHTPLHSANLLLNGWLTYQTLSCRFWGRSSFYQSGGAFGYRDQLQDSMTLVYFAPELAREHILRCAARQFPEGDVQHWWHPEGRLGVRTRCSDDFLWLPFVTAHYVAVTGDVGILDESIAYLAGPALPDDELERIVDAQPGMETATLLEHCLASIRHANRTGRHGLPLMGSGDWNDGMNLVGRHGQGESVWVAWFLIVVMRDFAALLRRVGREATAADLDTRRNALLATTEETCWDGEWYVRAFFDDGTPLGSHRNSEARIDSIAQSWAVLAGANPERARTAVQSAIRELVNEKLGLIHLFWPPFDVSEPHPGYIRGYPPGLRENGGQYTHGALWLAQACAVLGDGEEAVRLLQIMNPIEQSRDEASSALYGGEPYVIAADVYAAQGQEGRGGWSWYTGSASWLYRVWIEAILGFQLRGDLISIRPAMPSSWNEYSLTYQYGDATYEFVVRHAGTGPKSEDTFRLWPTPGTHRIEVYV